MFEYLLFTLSLGWISTFYLLYRLLKNGATSSPLSVSLFTYFILWQVLPVSFRLSGVIGGELQNLVADDLFIKYALLESLAFVTTVGLFSISQQKIAPLLKADAFNKKSSNTLVAAILIIGFIAFIYSEVSTIGMSYDERNAVAITMSDTTAAQVSGTFGFIINIACSLAIAILLERQGEKSKILNPWVWAFVFLAIISVVGLINGSRIQLLTPFLLAAIYLHAHNRMTIRLFIIGTLIAVFAVFVGAKLGAIVGSLRSEGQLTLEDIVSSDYEVDSSVAAEIFFSKFDSISPGSILVEYSGVGAAGFTPYSGAILAFIPRIILPSKPIPGSIDGTALGEPARLVPRLIGLYSDSLNMGVSPAAISIWHLGVIGFVMFILFNWVSLIIINTLLLAQDVLIKTIGVFSIGLPAVSLIIASPDRILMNQIRIAIILVIMYYARRIFSS